MGVHKASPLLWKQDSTNPLQPGGTYGVDVSCMLYRYGILISNEIYRNLSRDSVASVKDLTASWLDDWYKVHRFASLNIKFVFVFDGHELGLKVQRSQLRREQARH